MPIHIKHLCNLLFLLRYSNYCTLQCHAMCTYSKHSFNYADAPMNRSAHLYVLYVHIRISCCHFPVSTIISAEMPEHFSLNSCSRIHTSLYYCMKAGLEVAAVSWMISYVSSEKQGWAWWTNGSVKGRSNFYGGVCRSL